MGFITDKTNTNLNPIHTIHMYTKVMINIFFINMLNMLLYGYDYYDSDVSVFLQMSNDLCNIGRFIH